MADFQNKTTQMQRGPWVKIVYTSADSGISHIDGFNLVKKAIVTLTEQMKDPASVFTVTSDFLGNALDAEDSTLKALLQSPADMDKVGGKRVCVYIIIYTTRVFICF